MDEINERLDKICSNVTRPNTLNALHTCRPGHPWNKDNKTCWRNAAVMTAQLSWPEISSEDQRWLNDMAKSEQSAA